MASEEFFIWAEHIGAYEGAVAAVAVKYNERMKKRQPLPPAVKKAGNTPVTEVDAHVAAAMVNDGRSF